MLWLWDVQESLHLQPSTWALAYSCVTFDTNCMITVRNALAELLGAFCMHIARSNGCKIQVTAQNVQCASELGVPCEPATIFA
jgi:hypothetical protein